MNRRMLLLTQKLEAGYVSLFGSEDFIEGRKAEVENRDHIFHGRQRDKTLSLNQRRGD